LEVEYSNALTIDFPKFLLPNVLENFASKSPQLPDLDKYVTKV